MTRTLFRGLIPLAVACLMGLSLDAAPARAGEAGFISIGSGGVTGVYYPAGGAICRLVNKGRKEHGLRCSVESTSGSVFNLNAVRAGDLDFGIAQSDQQYNALEGKESFAAAGPDKGLRSVFSLHAEPFTVIARAGLGIRRFEDLRGKRVNIGEQGSGQRATLGVLLPAMGWTSDAFAQTTEFKPAEQAQALCDGRIDATIYTVGHPNGAIKEATTACDSVLVAVDNDGVRALVRQFPFYSLATIPGGMYRGSDDATRTFGVRATLVADARVPEDAVYALVKAVFANFDDFRKLHPAFAELKKEEMASVALSAPLHPGARRYYQEAGLLK